MPYDIETIKDCRKIYPGPPLANRYKIKEILTVNTGNYNIEVDKGCRKPGFKILIDPSLSKRGLAADAASVGIALKNISEATIDDHFKYLTGTFNTSDSSDVSYSVNLAIPEGKTAKIISIATYIDNEQVITDIIKEESSIIFEVAKDDSIKTITYEIFYLLV